MSQLAQVSRWVKGFSSAPVLVVLGKAERPKGSLDLGDGDCYGETVSRKEPYYSMMLIQEEVPTTQSCNLERPFWSIHV